MISLWINLSFVVKFCMHSLYHHQPVRVCPLARIPAGNAEGVTVLSSSSLLLFFLIPPTLPLCSLSCRSVLGGQQLSLHLLWQTVCIFEHTAEKRDDFIYFPALYFYFLTTRVAQHDSQCKIIFSYQTNCPSRPNSLSDNLFIIGFLQQIKDLNNKSVGSIWDNRIRQAEDKAYFIIIYTGSKIVTQQLK